MPDMSGLEVQQWFVRNGNLVPMVFITAHDEAGARARERALGMGAVAFLRKPFNDESLIRTLRVALDSGAGAGRGF
jgi:FixJ family two-component response regulator